MFLSVTPHYRREYCPARAHANRPRGIRLRQSEVYVPGVMVGLDRALLPRRWLIQRLGSSAVDYFLTGSMRHTSRA